jgi:hypothetical protein
MSALLTAKLTGYFKDTVSFTESQEEKCNKGHLLLIGRIRYDDLPYLSQSTQSSTLRLRPEGRTKRKEKIFFCRWGGDSRRKHPVLREFVFRQVNARQAHF